MKRNGLFIISSLVCISLILMVVPLASGCASPTSTPPPTTATKPATTAATTPASTAPATTAPKPTTSSPAATTTSPAAAQPNIKIGAILHMTGENAVLGPPVKNALEYRLEQAGGQVAGRKIELITEDDGTDPVKSVDKARKLVQQDKVDVILGPVHGACAPAVANFLTPSKTPHIIFMQKSIGVLKLGGGNEFLPFGTLEGTGYSLGLYAYDKLGYRTATVAVEDFVSGLEFVGGVTKAFQKRGGTIIQTQPIKQGTMDFSPNLTAMKQADVVFFWFTPVLAQRFVAQYYAAGLKMPLVIPNATVLFPQSLAQIGEKSVGIVGSSPYTTLIDTPMNKSYVEAYSKKYNAVPMAEGVSADVAMTMYLEAVKTTGGDTSSAKINEALRKVKVETPAGTYSFDPSGLGIGDLYIIKVVKLPDRLDWAVADKYSQIPMDIPAN